MKKAMYTLLKPVESKENEWTWDKAEEMFEHKDLITGKPISWREEIYRLAREFELKLDGHNLESIEGLATLVMREPMILYPDLYVIKKYKGFINKMPANAVVLSDENEEPAVLIWEEDL